MISILNTTGLVLQIAGIVSLLVGCAVGAYITQRLNEFAQIMAGIGSNPSFSTAQPASAGVFWFVACAGIGGIIGLVLFGLGGLCQAQARIVESSEETADLLRALVHRRKS